MINLYYDSKRPENEGNYYLELVKVTFREGEEIGKPRIPYERFGYWCDERHLKANFDLLKKQLSQIKKRQPKGKLRARRSQNPVD